MSACQDICPDSSKECCAVKPAQASWLRRLRAAEATRVLQRLRTRRRVRVFLCERTCGFHQTSVCVCVSQERLEAPDFNQERKDFTFQMAPPQRQEPRGDEVVQILASCHPIMTWWENRNEE